MEPNVEMAEKNELFSRAGALEDRALKAGMQAFGESVMKYLGQSGTVRRVAPTEQVHLEMRQLQEDFNFEMQEGYWRHYEFESDGITVADLRRFREYEAYVSMVYQVPVITTVLCSSRVKRIRSKLKQGINTYHVEVIHLRQMDGDKVLRELKRKVKKKKELTRDDLVPLLLTPLMSGDTTVYERIVRGFRILRKAQGGLETEELKKMQAILYTFACKFLTEEEVKKIKEEMDMTLLGQLLVEDGWNRGIKEGIEKGMKLMQHLFADGRLEDARLAAENEEVRQRLYSEYGLGDSKEEVS